MTAPEHVDPEATAILAKMGRWSRRALAADAERAIQKWRNTGDDAYARDALDILTRVLDES